MPAKSRFTKLDAFTKTVDEARVRTTSGGIVTIASLLIVFYLAFGEWTEYKRIVVHPELIVDKGRGEKMEIHLNITFPKIPCELLTLDATHLDPDYCGGCYGATPPPNAQKAGCCNTCEEVREAYASVSWAFGRGENVEQCEREHYAERLDAQRKEGCRIEGGVRVNKVIGNFHIAPGRSFSNGNMHVHDLANYFDTPVPGGHVFTHKIHSLRFGPQLPDNIVEKLGSKPLPWTNHHLNPLDNTEQIALEPAYNFMYFVKVVPTSYLPLGWRGPGPKKHHVFVDIGALGQGKDGSVETHQFSVTSHRRSLSGGDDGAEGHKEKLHARGGIPGVFFSYDISPMKVINREERNKSLSGFLTGLCAIIGGTLTVAAAVDRFLYEGTTRLKKLTSKSM
ncbi:copii-coated vesicle membrane protein [Diplocarpon rosae]|nr:copii-coated vesicle membrane protein [Diplocarpon rosae]